MVKKHQRWGLLPPMLHGTGLVLFAAMVIPLAAAIPQFIFDGWPHWISRFVIVSSLAVIASAFHTNAWLDQQAEAEGLLEI